MNWMAERKRRQAEEKEAKMAQLAEYRKTATKEVRDGREYLVVHVPDRYRSKKGAKDGNKG